MAMAAMIRIIATTIISSISGETLLFNRQSKFFSYSLLWTFEVLVFLATLSAVMLQLCPRNLVSYEGL